MLQVWGASWAHCWTGLDVGKDFLLGVDVPSLAGLRREI